MKKALPKNWVETELDSLFSLAYGKGLSVKELLSDGKYDVYGANSIIGKYNTFNQEKSKVIISCRGAASGAIHKTIPKSFVTSNSIVLDGYSDELLLPDFVKYFMTSTDKTEIITGTAQPQITIQLLKDLKFRLPPLAEQQRVVVKLDDLFGHLDLLKTRLDQIPQILKNFRQAALTQAVTGKLTEEWRVGKVLEDASKWRENIIAERKNSNLPKRTPGLVYEEVEETFDVPNSWTFGFLQNFGEFTRGKSKHRPRNDKKLFGGDYPFIQTGEVSRSNGLITDYTNTYSEFGLAQSRLFPKGTLCITIAANIAETGILDFDACFPDSVVGYIPYKKLYSVEFAMFCLMTMQKDLEHFAPSTAQKNINLGILFEVPFPVPSKEEQTEIVKRVEHLFAKADTIEAQYKSLKTKIDSLPQAILAKAFKGELVEQLETDGDAKDLLAEIKKLKAEVSAKNEKTKRRNPIPKPKPKKNVLDANPNFPLYSILLNYLDGISEKELYKVSEMSQHMFLTQLDKELESGMIKYDGKNNTLVRACK